MQSQIFGRRKFSQLVDESSVPLVYQSSVVDESSVPLVDESSVLRVYENSVSLVDESSSTQTIWWVHG